VVLSGEIDMQLDDSTVRLRAGDVLVQQATMHDLINRGKLPCVIAFVLVPAKPAVRDGKVLGAWASVVLCLWLAQPPAGGTVRALAVSGPRRPGCLIPPWKS
jgi:hypothetical protein